MSWPKNVLKNVLKFIFLQFLIVVQEIKSEDKDLFFDSKTDFPISESATWGPCLVKTLKTDIQRREKEVIPNLKSGLKVPSEEKKKKFRIQNLD